jgi:D-erythro-7,8-dihydroneopterin triphosphate epimerase
MKIDHNFKINITDLKVKTIIGALEEEKQNPQIIIINAIIQFDGVKSAKSDNIDDTVDYFEITKLIKEKVEQTKFELLEKLVDSILKIIMKFHLVTKAKVEIQKPQALAEFGAMVSLKASATR